MPPRRPPPHRPKYKRPIRRKPVLTVAQILEWADDFQRRAGRWPTKTSGRIFLQEDTWNAVSLALSTGCRGLPGGTSLAKLLAQHRGHRNRSNLPELTESEIILWAKIHFERTGEWPNLNTGEIHGLPGESWYAVNAAMMQGSRGLPGGSSLAKLLAASGLRRHREIPPDLSIEQILTWADAFHARRGKWPIIHSGSVDDSPDDNWDGINESLRDGKRGLPGGSSLMELLFKHRDVRPNGGRLKYLFTNLTESEIIRWAKSHFQKTGKWPTSTSGAVEDSPDDTWGAIHGTLRRGGRGLTGGSSLARLLAAQGLKRNHRQLTAFIPSQILDWADEFQKCHGEWPNKYSGPIAGCPEESWMAVDTALVTGRRGLAGGCSLTAFLNEHRGIFNGKSRRPKSIPESEMLHIEQILRWGNAHREQCGRWPQASDDSIPGTSGLTWAAVNSALRKGNRGLPGGSSLSRLFREGDVESLDA